MLQVLLLTVSLSLGMSFFSLLLTLRQRHRHTRCSINVSVTSLSSLFFHSIVSSTLSFSLSLSLCQTLAYFLLSIQFIVSIDVFLLLPLLSSQVLQLYCFSNSFSLQTLVLSGDDYYLIPRRKQISKSFPAVVSLFLSSPRLLSFSGSHPEFFFVVSWSLPSIFSHTCSIEYVYNTGALIY